jgi:peptide/nickel transport system substrate-binding protein
MMRPLRTFGLIVALLAACTPVRANTNGPEKNTLRVSQFWQIRRLNPALGTFGFEAEANYLIFDRLVWRGIDGEPIPGLLESWETLDGGRSLVVHLRPNARFHDGEPVTTDDLIFTFDAILDSANLSPYRYDLQIIQAVERLDERSALIRLRHPSPHFPELLDFGLLPAHLLRNHVLANDPFNQHPIGAGPFRVVKFADGVLEIERNVTYYGAPPGLDRITVTSGDSDELWRRLLAGQIDVGLLIPWSKRRFLAQLKTVRMDEATRRFSLGLWFNSRRPPFDRVEARRAIADAIDRASLVEKTEFGFGTATQRLDPAVPPWTHYDISAAKRELGGRTIHIAVEATSSDHIELAMNLQRQLSAADVTLQIDTVPQLDQASMQQTDMNFCGSIEPRPLELGASKYGAVLKHIHKPVETVVDRIAETQDEPTRRALFQEVEDHVLSEVPLTILFWQTTFSAYRAEYCGYHMVNFFDGLERIRPCP